MSDPRGREYRDDEDLDDFREAQETDYEPEPVIHDPAPPTFHESPNQVSWPGMPGPGMQSKRQRCLPVRTS